MSREPYNIREYVVAMQAEEQAQKDVAQARKDALQQLHDLNLELSSNNWP